MNCSRTLWQRTQIGLVCMMLAACGGGGGEPTTTPEQVSGLPQVDSQAVVSPPVAPSSTPAPGNTPAPGSTPVPDSPPIAKVGADYSKPVAKTGMKAQERIGVNLSGVSDYSATHEFVDLLMQSRGFGPPAEPWSTTKTVRIDPVEGWPLEDFGVVVFTGQQRTPGLGGIYTIKFKGPQSTVFRMIASTPGTVTERTYDAATQENTIKVDYPEGGAQMHLSFTGTGGTVRDLKIIRPGYDATNPPTFTTPFLEHLSRFSALRFMDWAMTNDAAVATAWANRPSLKGKRGAGQFGMAPGMPWERAIELANVTASDMWVNVPVNASDDYVRGLAALIKAQLAPNLKVYVEYSNEVWNPSFFALNRNKDASVAALAASPKVTRIDYDGSTSQWEMAYRYFAEQSMKMSNLFREAFPDEMMTRIRPVIAWQAAGGAGTGSDMLRFIKEAYGQTPGQFFYAYSGAPYFNLGAQQNTDGLGVEDVLNALAASITYGPTQYQYERNVMLAHKHGMKFIGYEGGPDTASTAGGSLESKAAANRATRMLDLCKNYLDTWSKSGAGLFMWFHSGAGSWNTKHGSWALAESLVGEEGPKMQCMNWAANTPAPTPEFRHNVGQAFDTAEVAEGDSVTSRLWWSVASPGRPLERNYLIGANSDGCVPLVLGTYFTNDAGPTLEVHVNGVRALNIGPLAKTATTTDVDVGQVCLKKGPNALTIKAVSIPASGYINRIKVGG